LNQTEIKSDDELVPLTSDTRTVDRIVYPVIEEKPVNQSVNVDNNQSRDNFSYEQPYKLPERKQTSAMNLS